MKKRRLKNQSHKPNYRRKKKERWRSLKNKREKSVLKKPKQEKKQKE